MQENVTKSANKNSIKDFNLNQLEGIKSMGYIDRA